MFNKILTMLLVVLAVSLLFFSISYTLWTNGDEVHYLVATSSLIKDHDLNLTNNYADYDYFLHHGHAEMPHIFPGVDGSFRPSHGVLLSILAIPGYLSRPDLAIGVRFSLALISIFGLYIVYLLLKELKFNDTISKLSVLVVGAQYTFFLYSIAIVPDMLSGFFYVLLALMSLKYINTQKRYFLVLAGIVAGLMLVLHFKLIALVLFFVVCFGYRAIYQQKEGLKSLFTRSSLSKLGLFNGPILLTILGASYVNYRWWGYFRYDAISVISFQTSSSSPWANPIFNTLAMLFDYERGLFWVAPVLIFALVSVFIVLKNFSHKWLFIPILLYLFAQSTFFDWTAGFAPNARYIVFTLPVLPLVFAVLFDYMSKYRQSTKIKIVYGLIAFLSLVGVCYGVLSKMRNYYNYPTGEGNVLWKYVLGKVHLERLHERLLKYVTFGASPDYNLAAVGLSCVCVIGLLLYGYYLAQKPVDLITNE